ncbi:unnamed protein product [Pleuronectes platessa]|uniref:Uncharacterized protein n=1 Tax=Pleuronectes platessa TaxID=8262 RepID=A0A9N7TKI7_PLEPL|nr:unnamed protein product [Pleuronectes platessa]
MSGVGGGPGPGLDPEPAGGTTLPIRPGILQEELEGAPVGGCGGGWGELENRCCTRLKLSVSASQRRRPSRLLNGNDSGILSKQPGLYRGSTGASRGPRGASRGPRGPAGGPDVQQQSHSRKIDEINMCSNSTEAEFVWRVADEQLHRGSLAGSQANWLFQLLMAPLTLPPPPPPVFTCSPPAADSHVVLEVTPAATRHANEERRGGDMYVEEPCRSSPTTTCVRGGDSRL